MTWKQWTEQELEIVRAAGQWRAPRDFDAAGVEGKLGPDGQPVVAFASNDYLGLTQHREVIAAAHHALDRWGTGSGSARLIVGTRPVHRELEEELADWRETEAATVFPTGFAANLGVLATFADSETLVVSDELNHASIIDGCRLARADVAIARHGDPEHVDELLKRASGRRALVVTDAVFSMDGDLAPLNELAEVCTRNGALLVVDEAHSVISPPVEYGEAEVLRVGTLSKTLGALGGFVAGPRAAVDLIVNRSRTYIFTTAPTPADMAAALAAVKIVRSQEGDALREILRSRVRQLQPEVKSPPSPIIPIRFGTEQATLGAAAALLEQGFLVPAIRPPTVPVGTSRLRIALSATHSSEQVDALARALVALRS